MVEGVQQGPVLVGTFFSGHGDTENRRWRARKCFGLGLVCSCLMVFKEAGWHAVLTPPIGIRWEFLLIFTGSGACMALITLNRAFESAG